MMFVAAILLTANGDEHVDGVTDDLDHRFKREAIAMEMSDIKRYPWNKADTMWGKRSWNQANTMWGKRSSWNQANTMWGKRGWEKANTMWGK